MFAKLSILVNALQSIQLLSVLRKQFFSVLIGQFSFSLFYINRHLGSTFTGTDRNTVVHLPEWTKWI